MRKFRNKSSIPLKFCPICEKFVVNTDVDEWKRYTDYTCHSCSTLRQAGWLKEKLKNEPLDFAR